MEPDVKAWLLDVQKAIREIRSFLPEKFNFDWFRSDVKTKRAVERNLEIIGEAISRVTKARPHIVIPNARKIIDTRNRIIHGYDVVSDEVLYGIVVRNLDELEQDVARLIADL
ncbi:MAG: DUF86 domain-containing protein [Cyclobacteriaceae bacterium]|jgi:uncharacterized protein with HEPN domain